LTARIIRWAVLGLLLPALAAAPAVAVCVDCADTGCSCCCAKSGGCQKSPSRTAPQATCCVTPTAPLPPAAAATVAPVDPTPVKATAVVEPVACDAQGGDVVAPDMRVVSSGTHALYTLHAAFLI